MSEHRVRHSSSGIEAIAAQLATLGASIDRHQRIGPGVDVERLFSDPAVTRALRGASDAIERDLDAVAEGLQALGASAAAIAARYTETERHITGAVAPR